MLRNGKTLQKFGQDEDGTVTIYSTMTLVLVLAITGASVDFMNHEADRAELQTALDRAVLAAADLDQMQPAEDVVADYVAKAGLSRHVTGITATAGLNDRVVAAEAGLDFQTVFLRMSGYDHLPMHASATAEERIANVEISLVLDISGSMRYNQRLANLQPAAVGFVQKVLNADSEGVTTLNLVPFAGQVNPGDIMFNYFRGERPKIKNNENNGWGNGDQDAPGGSLCNNGAENEYEGSTDPSCSEDGTVVVDTGFFVEWPQAISNVVFYFDSDANGEFDDRTDIAHKIEGFPETAPRDPDEFFKGAVAYLMAQNPDLTDPDQFLGASVKGGNHKTQYFQVKGDVNGPDSDLGPTKNQGRLPGNTYQYGTIDFAAWEGSYVQPDPGDVVAEDGTPGKKEQNVNMPSSCVEIYNAEFANSALPVSNDYVPHFHHWDTAPDVMDWGWCPEDDTAIQYYSDDAAALTEFIENIRMHDGTGIQYGMKYALALLDPATRETVSHMITEGLVAERFEGRPIAWEDQETEKFIVVMTDGQVTDQWRPNDPFAAINGEVETQNQGNGAYYNWSNRSNNLANLYAQCDLAHQNGVTVFAIAFETTNSAAEEMRHCASSDSHFFHVHGAEIIDAFDTVARQINNLRLIQ